MFWTWNRGRNGEEKVGHLERPYQQDYIHVFEWTGKATERCPYVCGCPGGVSGTSPGADTPAKQYRGCVTRDGIFPCGGEICFLSPVIRLVLTRTEGLGANECVTERMNGLDIPVKSDIGCVRGRDVLTWAILASACVRARAAVRVLVSVAVAMSTYLGPPDLDERQLTVKKREDGRTAVKDFLSEEKEGRSRPGDIVIVSCVSGDEEETMESSKNGGVVEDRGKVPVPIPIPIPRHINRVEQWEAKAGNQVVEQDTGEPGPEQRGVLPAVTGEQRDRNREVEQPADDIDRGADGRAAPGFEPRPGLFRGNGSPGSSVHSSSNGTVSLTDADRETRPVVYPAGITPLLPVIEGMAMRDAHSTGTRSPSPTPVPTVTSTPTEGSTSVASSPPDDLPEDEDPENPTAYIMRRKDVTDDYVKKQRQLSGRAVKVADLVGEDMDRDVVLVQFCRPVPTALEKSEVLRGPTTDGEPELVADVGAPRGPGVRLHPPPAQVLHPSSAPAAPRSSPGLSAPGGKIALGQHLCPYPHPPGPPP